jgi:hypothetical protein
VARTLNGLTDDPRVAPTIEIALRYLRELFAMIDGAGLALLREAVRGVEDEETAAQSCMALAQDLLAQSGR